MGEVESGKTRKSDRIFPSLTSDEAFTDGRLTALLDEGASFEGKLSFEGVVRIGGSFRGEIFTRDTLVINPGATVEAEVAAVKVIVCVLPFELTVILPVDPGLVDVVAKTNE